MGWGEDFSEVVSNPAFLLGAAGALAPEEVNIGGTWWRVAPRLRGLSQVMGAARGSVDERKAAEGMAGLAQGIGDGTGGAQLPWPPVAPQQGAPAGPESAPTATSRAPLPPGMARAALVQRMTPEMFRGLRNRAQIAGLDTIMGAAEAQAKDYETAAKKKAIYDAMRAGLSKTYPPEIAEQMARSAAENLQAPSEGFMTTPLAEREAKANAAQMALRKTQEEQGFLNEAAQIDPNNYEQVKAFQATAREKYPTIPFSRVFGSDPTAHFKFQLQEVKTVNQDALKAGVQFYPEIGANGEVAIKAHEYKGSPEDAQAMARGTLALVKKMVDAKTIPPDVATAFQLSMENAMRARNPAEVIALTNDAMGIWRAHMVANAQRGAGLDILKGQEWLGAIKEVGDKITEIDKALSDAPYEMVSGGGIDPAKFAKTPQGQMIVRRREFLQKRRQIWVNILAGAGALGSPAELRALIAKGAQAESLLPDPVGQILSAPPTR